MICTAEITEGAAPDYERLWNSRIAPPRGLDVAHGWKPGFYAAESNSGEMGNAWAWVGPYETENQAIAAVEEENADEMDTTPVEGESK